MIKSLLLGLLAFLSLSLYAQTDILVSDADLLPIDCADYSDASAQTFFDAGGSAANYSPNENDTITICPDMVGGRKIQAIFATNTGFAFDIHPSDTLYIYDGNDTNGPLLGKFNNGIDPTGGFALASWENVTGCLTFVFISDGADEGTGWDANVACTNPPQPFTPLIAGWQNGVGAPDTSLGSIVPRDTGYVNMCLGDSVLLMADGEFPWSLENSGSGYSQTVDNMTYVWQFSDGSSQTGDSVWFKPQGQFGYIVTLKMTDNIGFIQSSRAKIRISTTPNFASAYILGGNDSICIGDQTTLVAGIEAGGDTVGVAPNAGIFLLGGTFAGLTFLPDGSGAQYSTGITVSGFEDDQVITSASDVAQICITMEHSFIGDLEIGLYCPDGSGPVAIFDAYDPGFMPGGYGGGGTFLGDPIDDGDPPVDGSVVGEGWEYCFSTNLNATQGTFANETGNTVDVPLPTGGTNPSMNPDGIYELEGNFMDFAGCPINGDWSLAIQDNMGADDGYIFEWGIFFNSDINPNAEFYSTEVVSTDWLDPWNSVVSENDTSIVVQPDSTGLNPYIFSTLDEYGCTHDTTMNIYVFPLVDIGPDTLICGQLTYDPEVLYSDSGLWTYVAFNGTDTIAFDPDSMTASAVLTGEDYGIYTVYYVDSACLSRDTAVVEFYPNPNTSVTGLGYMCGPGVATTLTTPYSEYVDTYTWQFAVSPTATYPDSSRIEVNQEGLYSVTATNQCGTSIDQFEVLEIITMPNDTLICDDLVHPVSITSSGHGLWTYSTAFPTNLTFTPDSSAMDITVQASGSGNYMLYYYDSICDISDSMLLRMHPTPLADIITDNFCEGNLPQFSTMPAEFYTNYEWAYDSDPGLDMGNNSSATGTGEGTYRLTVTGECGQATDVESILEFIQMDDDTLVCDDFDTPVNIQASGNGQWTYATSDPQTISFTPDDGSTSVQVQASGSGNYVLYYYDAFCDATDSMVVQFHPSPITNLTGEDFCKGTVPYLSAQASEFFTGHTWSYLEDPAAALGNTHAIDGIGEGNYAVTVTSACGAASDTVFVEELVKKSDDILACDEFTQSIAVKSFGGTWSFASDSGYMNFFPGISSDTVTVTVNNSGLYYAIFHDNTCNSYDTIALDLRATPAVDMFANQNFCNDIGDTVWASTSTNIDNYIWTNLTTGTTFGDSSHIYTFEGGLYEVQVTGYCGGDLDTLTVISRDCAVNVPNVITPNDDGMNDSFVLEGMEEYGHPGLYIYNRWGTQVYETSEYHNDWQGTTTDGTKLSEGTYYYTIQPSDLRLCETKLGCQGVITLIRDE